MANLGTRPIRTRDDIAEFETEMTLDERLPEQSILEVFEKSAESGSKLTMKSTFRSWYK